MSIWQTDSWQKMLVDSKQTEQFFVVDGVYVEKRRICFGKYGLFVLGLQRAFSEVLCQKFIALCKKENCVLIQYETYSLSGVSVSQGDVLSMKRGFYKKFIPPYTVVIDLQKSEDEILASMKPKGRYNIKLAVKKGVIVKKVEKTKKNIDIFYGLMRETTQRNGFYGNSGAYYKCLLGGVHGSELLFAYNGDRVIAGGIFIFGGEVSMYYYGVSTSDKRDRSLMAPYLLQWEAIKRAKTSGGGVYDFGGVAGPMDKNSSLLGVTDFKMKLTSDRRQISESYIWINKKVLYTLIVLLREVKNFF